VRRLWFVWFSVRSEPLQVGSCIFRLTRPKAHSQRLLRQCGRGSAGVVLESLAKSTIFNAETTLKATDGFNRTPTKRRPRS
jgi:hypothetical protein